MTARATPLALRATPSSTPPPPAGSTWSTARDLLVLANGLERLGYRADELLASVGLRRAELEAPDVWLPCDTYGKVVASAQRVRYTSNLMLRVAAAAPPGSYPLLEYIIATSDTVEHGLSQMERYLQLVLNPAAFTLERDAGTLRVRTAASPLGAEFLVALTVLRLRDCTDGSFKPALVCFAHEPDDAQTFAQVLGTHVRSKAGWSGFCVGSDARGLALRGRDPVLRQLLEERAAELLARTSAFSGLAADVQRLLAARLAEREVRLGTIARALAMSSRTLQRRLAAEGVSYDGLLDGVRKETAGRYLRESALAAAEVAYLVGFAEATAFHRAFRRWYGVSPGTYRREHARSVRHDRDRRGHDPRDQIKTGPAARDRVHRALPASRRAGRQR